MAGNATHVVTIDLVGSSITVDPPVVRVAPGDKLSWKAAYTDLNWIVLFHDNKCPFDAATPEPVVHGRGDGQQGGTLVDRTELVHRYGAPTPWVIKYSVIVQKDGSDQPIVRDPIVVIRDV